MAINCKYENIKPITFPLESQHFWNVVNLRNIAMILLYFFLLLFLSTNSHKTILKIFNIPVKYSTFLKVIYNLTRNNTLQYSNDTGLKIEFYLIFKNAFSNQKCLYMCNGSYAQKIKGIYLYKKKKKSHCYIFQLFPFYR